MKKEVIMYQFPIGVMMDCFKLDTRQAIEKAASIGAKGLQMYAIKGDLLSKPQIFCVT